MDPISHYNKHPVINVSCGDNCAWAGWNSIGKHLRDVVREKSRPSVLTAVDCYTGVLDDEVLAQLREAIKPELVIPTHSVRIVPNCRFREFSSGTQSKPHP